MFIGMHIKRYEKEMEKKYGKFINQEKLLKNKIADLIAELHMIKYGKESPSELEEYQNKIVIDQNEIVPQSEGDNENKLKVFEKKEGFKGFRTLVSNRDTSQGITRVINIGTTTQEFSNAIITKRTTNISYKRRNEKINQQ